MSSIHYFQRYSQKENVVTNNTLLLFSRLYYEAPLKFKEFINIITDEVEINVGVDFHQQTKAINSIPDGAITQESFKIAIETKLTESFRLPQLTNHLKSFQNETTQILLALSPSKINHKELDEAIKREVQTQSKNLRVKFISATFKDIVEAYRGVINNYDIELNVIIDDYEEFCISENLIRNDEYRMLAVACGATLSDNFEYNIYFDPASRGHSYFTHLGIYHNKSVRGIGKIENIIIANLLETDELEVLSASNGDITDKQQKNIIATIHAAKTNIGWDITKNHKFFCVKKFVKTDFRKETKNGLYGKKYFDLKSLSGRESFESTEEIAEILREISW